MVGTSDKLYIGSWYINGCRKALLSLGGNNGLSNNPMARRNRFEGPILRVMARRCRQWV